MTTTNGNPIGIANLSLSKTMCDVIAAVDAGATTPLLVADELSIDNDTAGQYLRRLVKHGMIAKLHRGLYGRTS